jgi:hypothetical protein
VKQMIVFGMCAALAFAGACGKSGDKAGGSGGGIDKAAFDKVVDGVHSGDTVASAQPALDKLMGPVKVKSDKEWIWAVDDGTDCWQVRAMLNGDKIAGLDTGKVNKMVEKSYAKCAARAKGEQP